MHTKLPYTIRQPIELDMYNCIYHICVHVLWCHDHMELGPSLGGKLGPPLDRIIDRFNFDLLSLEGVQKVALIRQIQDAEDQR